MGERRITQMTRVTNVTEVRKGQYRVWFLCDYCSAQGSERRSHYNRKQRHFCSTGCYSCYRAECMAKEDQNRYGTGFDEEERLKRRNARSTLNHHIRDKGLERQPCEVCGALAEAHHDDYDKPLDVRWLCFKHHRAHHKTVYQNPELLQ